MILDTDALVKRLRYQGEQYSNGSLSRGGGPQIHYLTQAANKITELQAELDCYCPRPSNGQTDNTSAGCIKRGECGCDIRSRLKSGGTPNE
jgi:hypothetical protein